MNKGPIWGGFGEMVTFLFNFIFFSLLSMYEYMVEHICNSNYMMYTNLWIYLYMYVFNNRQNLDKFD